MTATPVPPGEFPIADSNGRVTNVWNQFFNNLVGGAAAIETINVTGSPFSYTANETGHLQVSNGTISSVQLTRARLTINTGTSGFIPMSNGDTVRIVWTVKPTLRFIPE